MIPFEVVRREGELEERAQHAPALMRFISSQVAGMRRELRMGCPALTRDDLRRYRMYEAESVLLELLSGGADWAGQVLWQLLQLDKQSRAQLDAQAARALRRPALANCPELLHALALELTAADKAIKKGDLGLAGARLLVLAELSWARGLSCWWLTERLLQLAAEQSSGWLHDAGLCEASVALARGAFLLRQLNECGESLEHLTRAAQLSAGKPWRAVPSLLKLLGADQQIVGSESAEHGVFQVSSRALSEALVQEARAARKQQDHARAAALCGEAVQRAQDARAVRLELGAQRELGVCLLAASKAQEAATAFREFLSLARAAGSAQDIVTAHLKLALCFHSQGDSDSALRSLREARAAAEELGQPHLLAKAHTYLGELFLNTSQPRYATTHLHASCAQFAQLDGFKPQCDRARVLAGVAGGLELMAPLLAAIRESGPGGAGERRGRGRARLLKLTAWKDRHKPFWPEEYPVSNAVKSLYTSEPRAEQDDGVDEPTTKEQEESKSESLTDRNTAEEGETAIADNSTLSDYDSSRSENIHSDEFVQVG